jgi:hypothetical protein
MMSQNALVVYVSQICEKQLLYNTVWDLTISNERLNTVMLIGSSGSTVRFVGVMIGVFWKRERRPI